MKQRIVLLCVFAISVVVVGCSDDDVAEVLAGTGIPEASLYVYNQMTDDVTADVHAGDSLFERLVADDLPYSDQTRIAPEEKIDLTSDTANTNIRVVRSDANTVGPVSPSLKDNGKYTVVVMGDMAQSQPVIHAYERLAAVPAPTNVRVRVINAAWNLQNAMVDGATLAYEAATGYTEKTPAAGAITFVVMGGGVTYNPTCNVTAGQSYDVILGYPNNSDPATPPANVSVFCHQI
ncbi:MAG: DUF4397 domain-containing protein [Pseudomonadota bacterium]|nr:MAG: DUF4397 domain-containing protein [Pseudomonadota bacterium]